MRKIQDVFYIFNVLISSPEQVAELQKKLQETIAMFEFTRHQKEVEHSAEVSISVRVSIMLHLVFKKLYTFCCCYSLKFITIYFHVFCENIDG